MHNSKHDQDSGSSKTNNEAIDTTLEWYEKLPNDILRGTREYLRLKEISKLTCTSRRTSLFFQPILDTAKALTAIVQGNPEALTRLVQKNPALLFQKGQVTDFANQTFYDVSPYQLMTFLGDIAMKDQIMMQISSVMTEHMTLEHKKQYAEIDTGGSDLVNIDRDPEDLSFEDLTRFTTKRSIDTRAFINARVTTESITFPLLENPDGIIYYKASNASDPQLYYANQQKRTCERIEPQAKSEQEQNALNELYNSFAHMEANSSRRSSNAEHELISRTMQHKLVRKGIRYTRKNIEYCNNRMEFELINCYRKMDRLYKEECSFRNLRIDQLPAGMSREQKLVRAKELSRLNEQFWLQDVGQAQRSVIWIMQGLCQPGCISSLSRMVGQIICDLNPAEIKADSAYPGRNEKMQSMLAPMTFSERLKHSLSFLDVFTNTYGQFTIGRGCRPNAHVSLRVPNVFLVPEDLHTVNLLVENSKKHVIDFASDLHDETSLSSGPG